jgi:hypothetical protein
MKKFEIKNVGPGRWLVIHNASKGKKKSYRGRFEVTLQQEEEILYFLRKLANIHVVSYL